MSRSGYSDDDGGEPWQMIMWRGRVASATRGKRGQAFFRDLIAAMDAMPQKRLIANELVASGEVCAIGSLGLQRGVDMSQLDPEDAQAVGAAFDIAGVLAQEVVYMNDEWGDHKETPEARWVRMRAWAETQLKGQPA